MCVCVIFRGSGSKVRGLENNEKLLEFGIRNSPSFLNSQLQGATLPKSAFKRLLARIWPKTAVSQ